MRRSEWWRCRTNIYRIVYVFYTGRRIVFLHGFQKKSEKIPARELAVARQRYHDFLRQEREVEERR